MQQRAKCFSATPVPSHCHHLCEGGRVVNGRTGGRKAQISEGWDVSRVHIFSEVSEIAGIC